MSSNHTIVSRLPPEVTRAVVAEMQRSADAASAPRTPVIQHIEPEKPHVTGPLAPRDIRASVWFGTLLVSLSSEGAIGWLFGFILSRLGMLALNYKSARAGAVALCGPRVRQEAYERRMAICSECSANRQRITKTRAGYVLISYCGDCGCPESRAARLAYKNWLARWKCPRRRHEGPYPEDAYKHLIPIGLPVKNEERQRPCGGGH